MHIDTKGITRIVFVFDSVVIKIPNFTYSMQHFLQGCYANWSERLFCRQFEGANIKGNMYEWVAPSFWCSWFGLIQIMAKCEPNEVDLSLSQVEFYSPLCQTDIKKQNFGFYKGKLVCLDYA